MRLLLRVFSVFVVVFLAVAPRVRAQFDNGCCNRITEVFTTCNKGICLQHFVQYSCPVYAGAGVPGIKVLRGGVVCCSTIYQQLFSSGSCTGGTAASLIVEQRTRLAYVRTCFGTYELTLVSLPMPSILKREVSRVVSDATAVASK